MKRFVISVSSSPDFVDFRQDELQAVADLFGFPIDFEGQHLGDIERSFFSLLLPGDHEAKLLASRSIVVKDIFELWAHATTWPAVHQEVQDKPELWSRYAASTSFRFSFTQHNATRPPQSRVDLVNAFGYLNFKGPILLKSAELDIGVLEEFEENKHSAVAGNANYEARLRDIWVGRKVAVGQRHLIDVYDVKKRVHIGNTSMEAEASLLMANLAHAKSGACFYDPFAGTGSMLLTCAHFGAHVIGSDIDGRNMRDSGKQGKRGVFKAAEQYGTRNRIVDGLTFDLTQNPWRTDAFLDAIVTDPPYGVRAGAKRLGRKNPADLSDVPYKMADGRHSHEMADYIPPNMPWELADLLVELLDFSYRMLRPGGRLVYWLPTVTEHYQDSDVPRHPGMRIVANSEQPFNKWSRRLITMEKLMNESPSGAARPTAESQGESMSASTPAHHNFRGQYFAGLGRASTVK